MMLDPKSLLERLATHQLQVVAPAITDPKIAHAAGIAGLLLQQAATAIDAAPGRFRRRAADMQRIIIIYAEKTGQRERYAPLLDAKIDDDRLSGLYTHDCNLSAALVEIADAIDSETADWCVALRRDLRAIYRDWAA